MREFILKATKAVTVSFDLNDLPAAGRMDVVCRCVSNALFVSNVIRDDTIFHVALEGPSKPPRLISFYGKDIEGIAPDERNIASKIKTALHLGMDLKKDEELEISPGFKIANRSFEKLVEKRRKTHQLVYLHPKGVDIRKFEFKKDVCFILGDHHGIPKNIERLLDRLNAERVSIGKPLYLSSHVIIVCQNELDRKSRGFG
jgi:tRNA (pseudouridine54-N1)-methyltransferase